MRVSPGMRFLGLVPSWRYLDSGHTGHEEQERALKSLPWCPPEFCSFWMKVAVSTGSFGTNW